MTFKTNIIHRIEWVNKYDAYYTCNHAIGKLSDNQIGFKTNCYGKRITCKNCKKRGVK